MANIEKGKQGIRKKMLTSALVPTFITLIVLIGIAATIVSNAIASSVKSELIDFSVTVTRMFDWEYPGQFRKEGTEYITIYKGNMKLNDSYALIDSLVEDTGLEASIFYGDLRVLSTIRDEDNNRISGTRAPIQVINEVLDKNKPHFYTNSKLCGKIYYTYYAPITNDAGECVGMVGISKPAGFVNAAVWKRLIPLFIAGLAGMIFLAFVTVKTTDSLVVIIKKVQKTFAEMTNGKLDGSIDARILKRKDEFGDMGKDFVTMQSALRTMVEKDALTKINNRRFGENKLKQVMEQAAGSGTTFAAAIGDIDFFKKVNDTYGHDAGDDVLITVAGILNKSMAGKGFVARWGGEEFLLVFDKVSYEEGVRSLNAALDEIRATKVSTKEFVINVTMSFGITRGNADEETRILLKRADEHLYTAKTSGRNQVVGDEESTSQVENILDKEETGAIIGDESLINVAKQAIEGEVDWNNIQVDFGENDGDSKK